jgi:hypothetical protein
MRPGVRVFVPGRPQLRRAAAWLRAARGWPWPVIVGLYFSGQVRSKVNTESIRPDIPAMVLRKFVQYS